MSIRMCQNTSLFHKFTTVFSTRWVHILFSYVCARYSQQQVCRLAAVVHPCPPCPTDLTPPVSTKLDITHNMVRGTTAHVTPDTLHCIQADTIVTYRKMTPHSGRMQLVVLELDVSEPYDHSKLLPVYMSVHYYILTNLYSSPCILFKTHYLITIFNTYFHQTIIQLKKYFSGYQFVITQ